MSPRSRLGPDRSLSSPSLGQRPRERWGLYWGQVPGKAPCSAQPLEASRRACTALSPSDPPSPHPRSCLGASGKQELGTAQPQSRPPPSPFLGSPVIVLAGVGEPSPSSPSPLRPKELASLLASRSPEQPLSGKRAKRWEKDVYKLLKGKRKKVGGGAKRPRPPGSVDWGLDWEEGGLPQGVHHPTNQAGEHPLACPAASQPGLATHTQGSLAPGFSAK